ncbi:hypothetical protein [Pseudomonas sp. OIL-1]|uniref:TA system antitoxin ParD family protein n=1 Tax=Pseudomonas sp. OIL-1 TaxID=2706126 RepID=UPI0013A77271|nr:hypothetical protein [Pseudomonas sp. OIL-1]QIB52359.1 hypothetical protein G3M63_15700 [Pseudomonas sp. OIL-1]
MATSSPLRLDEKLVVAAATQGSLEKRTTPRQIEYWAEIGRAVERDLDARALLAIREGLARIRVEPVRAEPVASDDVFADIDLARATGTLGDRVSASTIRYQASRSLPGLLEQHHPDGRVETGRFRDGQFVPLQG